MVAIEIEEDFVFNHLGDAAFADKLLFGAKVALLHVSEIHIHDQLDFVIHLVLKHILDFSIIQFCHLDDGMRYFPAFAIPVGDEIFGFVHIPVVEIIVVLYPVFSEFRIDGLALQAQGKGKDDG